MRHDPSSSIVILNPFSFEEDTAMALPNRHHQQQQKQTIESSKIKSTDCMRCLGLREPRYTPMPAKLLQVKEPEPITVRTLLVRTKEKPHMCPVVEETDRGVQFPLEL